MTIGKCLFESCSNKPNRTGLCSGHYQQRRAGKELTPLRARLSSLTRDEQGRKSCCRCSRWLTEEEFHSSPRMRDGLDTACKLCHKLYKYGITALDYLTLLNVQDGGCAICGGQSTDGLALHVDHDHACCPDRKTSCGRCVRGLLCSACNTSLGLMRDDPQRLLSAVDYLKRGKR